jgi:mannose-6-phosphate isomerase-like protein (cupin superfamily)
MKPAPQVNSQHQVHCKEGDCWNVVGDRVICRVAGASTNATYSIVEVQSPPGGGPPFHIHQQEDELFLVVEGEFEICIGDRTIRALSGSAVMGQRGTPHRYRNVGSSTGRLLVTLIPAGFEEYFRELHEHATDGDTSPVSMVKLGQRYGLEFVHGGQSCAE